MTCVDRPQLGTEVNLDHGSLTFYPVLELGQDGFPPVPRRHDPQFIFPYTCRGWHRIWAPGSDHQTFATLQGLHGGSPGYMGRWGGHTQASSTPASAPRWPHLLARLRTPRLHPSVLWGSCRHRMARQPEPRGAPYVQISTSTHTHATQWTFSGGLLPGDLLLGGVSDSTPSKICFSYK